MIVKTPAELLKYIKDITLKVFYPLADDSKRLEYILAIIKQWEEEEDDSKTK